MTCSVPFRPHRSEGGTIQPSAGFHANPVTVLEDRPSHQRSREAQSLSLTRNPQAGQHLQAVAPAQTAGRRVGAGAGATPVFVADIRHDTSLARRVSLVGRSRTCPSSSVTNRHAIRMQANFVTKE